jgi:hypothetical protein
MGFLQAHSGTSSARDDLDEQERQMAELRCAAADAAGAVQRAAELEARLASQQRDGEATALVPCVLSWTEGVPKTKHIGGGCACGTQHLDP